MTIDSNSAALKDGAGQLDDGMAQLRTALGDGIDKLLDGTQQLAEGAAALADGSGQLRDGGKALSDGVSQLEEGGKELDDGMKKFKEEAIDKIIGIYSDDLEPLSERVKALTKLSGEYNSFSGHAEGVESEVKFIYETAAIRKKG